MVVVDVGERHDIDLGWRHAGVGRSSSRPGHTRPLEAGAVAGRPGVDEDQLVRGPDQVAVDVELPLASSACVSGTVPGTTHADPDVGERACGVSLR